MSWTTGPRVFNLDDEVTPVTGVFAGQLGLVDEVDPADQDLTYRVRFAHIDGEPISWYGAADLTRAAVAA